MQQIILSLPGYLKNTINVIKDTSALDSLHLEAKEEEQPEASLRVV